MTTTYTTEVSGTLGKHGVKDVLKRNKIEGKQLKTIRNNTKNFLIPFYLNSFTQTARIRFFVGKLALVMAMRITPFLLWCKHHQYSVERGWM